MHKIESRSFLERGGTLDDVAQALEDLATQVRAYARDGWTVADVRQDDRTSLIMVISPLVPPPEG